MNKSLFQKQIFDIELDGDRFLRPLKGINCLENLGKIYIGPSLV